MTAEAQQIVDVLLEETTNNESPEKVNDQEQEAPKPPEMDAFGRTVDERTIELEENDAEFINVEVDAGKHKTYGDALHYVLSRGFAEIKRTREAAKQLAEKTLLKAKRDNWSKLLQSNPSLITNQELLASMLRELGVMPSQQ